jgi:serine O-acetyltransferase
MDERAGFSSSLDPGSLTGYVGSLLATHFPDGVVSTIDLRPVVDEALARLEHNFSRIHRKYYALGGQVRFDHLNGDHLSMFLYLLGNSCWKLTGDTVVPTKLFSLNKILHGLDLFYSVALPEVFLLVHPVGTVIGNAEYRDYLVVYQNCTIGSEAGRYPRLGEGVVLNSRVSVIGDCTVGDNVVFGANAFLVGSDIPSDSIVVGQYPAHRVLPAGRSVRERFFDQAP